MKLFSRTYGWSPYEIDTFIVTLRKELNDMSYRLLDHA